MNVVLIYGGKSGEHEISLLSCASVIRNISERHKVSLISISKEGRWYKEDESVFREVRGNENAALSVHELPEHEIKLSLGRGGNFTFWSQGRCLPCDVVFPVLHGTYGEDGTIQGILEMAGVPFVGCGTRASAVCMDKETTKIILKEAGINVVPYICVTRSDTNDSRVYDALIERAVSRLGFPMFVKPCSAGSSDGAAKADTPKALAVAMTEAFAWDNKVLIERAIDAREIECSVMGNSVTFSHDTRETLVRAYGPGEIVPSHTFYDYDAKYNDPDGADLKIPALLDEAGLEEVRKLAVDAYRAVNASGMARVDFFSDRVTGELYLNEINTIPGFTSISMFPKMCEKGGLSYTALIDNLLFQAIEEHKARTRLCTSR